MNLARACWTLSWTSFRRLLWSTNMLLVLLPLAGPGLYFAWRRFSSPTPEAFQEFSQVLILLFMSIVIPLVGLAFGTGGLGTEREDRTLVYLLMRPVPRWLVLLAKLAGALPLALGLVIGSFWIYCRLAGELGATAWELYLPAVFFTTLAYVGLFHLFAVTFRHATIVALIYAMFVEIMLANLPGIIKRVAVNYYGRSLIYSAGRFEGLKTPSPRWFEPISPPAAEWALVAIFLGSVLLALAIFQTREYRDLS